jgi:PAS domain S-box-containing protein
MFYIGLEIASISICIIIGLICINKSKTTAVVGISYFTIAILSLISVVYIKDNVIFNSLIYVPYSLFSLPLFIISDTYKKQSNRTAYFMLSYYIFIIIYFIGICFISDISNYYMVVNKAIIMVSLYFIYKSYKIFKTLFKDMQIKYTYVLYTISQLLLLFVQDANSVLFTVSEVLRLSCYYFIYNILVKYNLINSYSDKKDLDCELNYKSEELKENYQLLDIEKTKTNNLEDIISNKKLILETILNESPMCVLLVDQNGYITNDDKGFTKIWDEYKDIKYRIRMRDFLHNHMQNFNESLLDIQKVYATGREVYGELVGNDGRYFECIYAPFIIRTEILGVVCAITDVTKKRKSEIKILENNAKYKKIVETIPYAILVYNNENVIYANKACEDVFEIEDYNDILNKGLSYKAKKMLSNSIKYDEYEYIYQSNKNNKKYLFVNKIDYFENNKKLTLFIINDITDYKDLINKAKKSKRKYKTLVNTIPEAIYITDAKEGTCTYANDATLDLLGLNNINQVIGNRVRNFLNLTPSDMKSCEDRTELLKTKKDMPFKRYEAIRYTDEKMYIESAGTSIDINNEIKIIGIIRDVTEQVMSEQLEEEIKQRVLQDKLKTEFFVNMSHELKTPLNVIFASNQLLQSIYKEEILKDPNGDIANTVKLVKRYSYILLRLVNNIMTLTRLEANFHKPKIDFYNIVNIIEDTVIEFSKFVENKDIQIIFDTDIEEKVMKVDPEDIEKIVLNLLSNSIKSVGEHGHIYVNIYNEGSFIQINVADNGCGIEKEKLELIFETYSNVFQEGMSGANMGLPLVKSLVELYKGTVYIKTDKNKGTELIINLPFDKDYLEVEQKDRNINVENVYAEYASAVCE